jgi:hypothetical protein
MTANSYTRDTVPGKSTLHLNRAGEDVEMQPIPDSGHGHSREQTLRNEFEAAVTNTVGETSWLPVPCGKGFLTIHSKGQTNWIPSACNIHGK